MTSATNRPAKMDGPQVITAIPRADVLRELSSLRTASTVDLKQRWREMFGREPPPFSRTFLQHRLAYRLQQLGHGGLKPETLARLAALGERLDGGNVALRRVRADDRPIAGTRLEREWRGVRHTITVLRDGFEFEGRPYGSLSAIARQITGTRWNGWAFFGLRNNRSTS